jgi:hypothetical protein
MSAKLHFNAIWNLHAWLGFEFSTNDSLNSDEQGRKLDGIRMKETESEKFLG